MNPTERHARNLARVAELEAEDAAAEPGPWVESTWDDSCFMRVYGIRAGHDGQVITYACNCHVAEESQLKDEDAFIVSMRNRNPAVLTLVRGVIERHAPVERGRIVPESTCDTDQEWWPCADYLAAENALGVGDE